MNRYWVGGTGTWNASSTTNWSATSGGASGASVPTSSDNVYFDANSFTAPGQIVTRAGTNPSCLDMDWTGALYNPTFANTNTDTLRVYGSFTLTAGMIFDDGVNFYGVGTHTITTAGVVLKEAIGFNDTGTYTLQDDLELYWIDINSSGNLYMSKGTLNCNNKNITCGRLVLLTGNTATINLGSGTHTIKDLMELQPGGTVNADTSTLYFTKSDGLYNLDLYTDTYTLYNVTILGGGNTFVRFLYSTTMNDFKILNGPTRLAIPGGVTLTCNSFVANGSPGNLVTIGHLYTATHNIVITGGIQTISNYVVVQHSIASPANTLFFNPTNSTDNQAVASAGSGWTYGMLPSILALLLLK